MFLKLSFLEGFNAHCLTLCHMGTSKPTLDPTTNPVNTSVMKCFPDAILRDPMMPGTIMAPAYIHPFFLTDVMLFMSIIVCARKKEVADMADVCPEKKDSLASGSDRS